MIEGILAATLFGSFIWFCIFTSTLLILFFVSEFNEEGSIAFFALIVYAAFMYLAGIIDPNVYVPILSWTSVLLYLGIGFLFSLIRTYFYGLKKKRTFLIKYTEPTKDDKDYAIQDMIYDLKGNVFRWWFMWPISAISWVIKDLLKDFCEFIYKHTKVIFKNIATYAFNIIK